MQLLTSLRFPRTSHLFATTGLLLLLGALPESSHAQWYRCGKKKDAPVAQAGDKGGKKPEGPKSIAEVTSAAVLHDGLFNLYVDTVKGTSWIAIPDSMLGREFIYFSAVADGAAETGLTRGTYRGSKVISFHRHFERIEVRESNTDFHYDPLSPLSRAADANINTPILASLKLEGRTQDSTGTTYLVSGDALFLAEEFQMVKPVSRRPEDGLLGKLSAEKSKIVRINNYAANTEVTVDYVYENRAPSQEGAALADARFITIGYQHSLLAMPEPGFEPRLEDPRVGYFTSRLEDMTSTESLPSLDRIHRWRLEKADPTADISDPVKPITWWIENTTPIEFRDIIRDGLLKWNPVFEAIGIRNAIEVKVQPDDADWDAGDIRYNVLRWTSTPSPAYSGYGPSFVNPRTGEILGADIMLEWSGMVGRLWRSEVFQLAGLPNDAMEAGLLAMGATEAVADLQTLDARSRWAEEMHRCEAGMAQGRNLLFGLAAMQARSFSDEDQIQFTKETLHRLVLHEVGHTLGLSHNMAGSTLHSPEDLLNRDLVRARGLCNSVMDYPAIHFTRDPNQQSKFFDDNPGVYDYWAIAYGYMTDNGEPEKLQGRLDALLKQSNQPDLRFGNDADDMRRAGGGMNPDVNIYDLSNDPVAYASDRCELVAELMPEIVKAYGHPGQDNYFEVRRAYLTLSGEYATQLGIMTRAVGGVRYNRALPAQLGTQPPLVPVSGAEQRAAVAALNRYAFAPDAYDFEAGVYGYLQDQRRGFGFFGAPEDPKIHERVLNGQRGTLAHLLHPRVLQRITDATLYGNDYPLDAYFADLTQGIFGADAKTAVNPMRQQLQLAYVQGLLDILNPEKRYDVVSQSVALANLRNIERLTRNGVSPNGLTRAHREHVLYLITSSLDR